MKKRTTTVRVNEQEMVDGTKGSSEDGEVFIAAEYNYAPLLARKKSPHNKERKTMQLQMIAWRKRIGKYKVSRRGVPLE